MIDDANLMRVIQVAWAPRTIAVSNHIVADVGIQFESS